ncbi:MAG: 30S ribosome-binding factor RbfA [Magnetococcales bacterium]|nr:30S ribosome-binding factor RbfA [Magnetococcales bacterium]
MGFRTSRVASEIRKIISAMLTRGEIRDHRVMEGMVSISDIEMSRDLQHATVYVTVMGVEPMVAMEGLARAQGFIRRRIGQQLRLRHTPGLHFRLDESTAHGAHMDRILADLNIPPEEALSETDDEDDESR